MVRCSVFGCGNNIKEHSHVVSFHRFPCCNIVRKQKWIDACGRDNFVPTIHSRICSKHFEPHNVHRYRNRFVLSRDAVPAVVAVGPQYIYDKRRTLRGLHTVLDLRNAIFQQPGPIMEWSDENVIKFLELFKTETILWDPCDVWYTDLPATIEAWERLRKNFSAASGLEHVSVSDLQRERQLLITIYNANVRLIKQLVRDGRAGEPCRWFAFELMDSFLGAKYVRMRTREMAKSVVPSPRFQIEIPADPPPELKTEIKSEPLDPEEDEDANRLSGVELKNEVLDLLIGTDPQRESPFQLSEVHLKSEAPDNLSDVDPQNESPDLLSDVAPPSDDLNHLSDADPLNKSPDKLSDIDPQSEYLEQLSDVDPPNEYPDQLSDVDPPSEDPDQLNDIDPRSEYPDQLSDIDPRSEYPDQLSDVYPPSEDQDNLSDVDPPSEDPDQLSDMDPPNEYPDQLSDIDPPSEDPDNLSDADPLIPLSVHSVQPSIAGDPLTDACVKEEEMEVGPEEFGSVDGVPMGAKQAMYSSKDILILIQEQKISKLTTRYRQARSKVNSLVQVVRHRDKKIGELQAEVGRLRQIITEAGVCSEALSLQVHSSSEKKKSNRQLYVLKRGNEQKSPDNLQKSLVGALSSTDDVPKSPAGVKRRKTSVVQHSRDVLKTPVGCMPLPDIQPTPDVRKNPTIAVQPLSVGPQMLSVGLQRTSDVRSASDIGQNPTIAVQPLSVVPQTLSVGLQRTSDVRSASEIRKNPTIAVQPLSVGPQTLSIGVQRTSDVRYASDNRKNQTIVVQPMLDVPQTLSIVNQRTSDVRCASDTRKNPSIVVQPRLEVPQTLSNGNHRTSDVRPSSDTRKNPSIVVQPRLEVPQKLSIGIQNTTDVRPASYTRKNPSIAVQPMLDVPQTLSIGNKRTSDVRPASDTRKNQTIMAQPRLEVRQTLSIGVQRTSGVRQNALVIQIDGMHSTVLQPKLVRLQDCSMEMG